MKKVSSLVAIATLSLVSVSFLAGSVQARSIQTRFDISAELLNINLDPKLNLNHIEGGTIQVKYDMHRKEDNYIRLVLNRGYYCPPNVYCALMMPAPYIVKVPLLQMKKDNCGSIIYSGKIDKRPVDGNFAQLIVHDHTGNKCPTFVALPETDVHYRLITAGMGGPAIDATSTMTAKKLD